VCLCIGGERFLGRQGAEEGVSSTSLQRLNDRALKDGRAQREEGFPPRRFASFERKVEILTNLELREAIQGECDSFSVKNSESRKIWLSLLFRELGKRHGREGMLRLERLNLVKNGAEKWIATAAVLGGWSINDPIAAGMFLLPDADEQIASLSNSFTGLSSDLPRSRWLRLVARDIFRKWAKVDPGGSKDSLLSYYETDSKFSIECWAGWFCGVGKSPEGRHIGADRELREPEIIGSYLGAIEAGVMTVSEALNEIRSVHIYLPRGLLKEVGELHTEKGWGILENEGVLLPGERLVLVEAMAYKDRDYDLLVRALPETEQISLLQELARSHHQVQKEDHGWPVNGRPVSRLRVTERTKAIEQAILSGPFDEEQRLSLELYYEERLRISARGPVPRNGL